ncbi:MAG: MFS transporter [Hyphomicrobiales bacterium]
MTSVASTLARIPRGIWILGFVSLFMDVSSEMIHALLPVYLVTVMGASNLAVGLIEGAAEALAPITKIVSGALSDRLDKRQPVAAFGYGLAALTKPVFALASTISWIVAARFIDRIGKGIRGAPRDALVADIAPAEIRGAAFGLRQSLDTVGAVIGPLVAIALMLATADDFRLVFWVAVIPAIVSFLLIAFAVHEPPRPAGVQPVKSPLSREAIARLGAPFWTVTAVATVFALARFSEAFLILRAENAGLGVAWAPAVLVVMSAVYTVAAYPAGVLSDRVGRLGLFAVGCGVLVLADLCLALGDLAVVWVGIALWGLHMGLTQGILAALVADTAPKELRGTAFGVLNFTTGVAALPSSAVAGLLWDRSGPEATFLAGAAFSVAALAGLALVYRKRS